MFGDAGDMTASEVFSALKGDPRLVLLDEGDLVGARIFYLATEHGLVASKSEFLLRNSGNAGTMRLADSRVHQAKRGDWASRRASM